MLKKVDETNKESLKNFLLKINNNEINEKFDNAYFIEIDSQIKGVIAYEMLDNIALIKYFIFYKNLDILEIRKLFEFSKNDILNNDFKIITICYNEESIELFLNLEFNIINKDKCFINDTNILKTDYKDAVVMQYLNKKN